MTGSLRGDPALQWWVWEGSLGEHGVGNRKVVRILKRENRINLRRSLTNDINLEGN